MTGKSDLPTRTYCGQAADVRVIPMNEEILIYKIKCPRCSAKADAIMTECGVKGTYREPTAYFIAERIECQECGLIQNKSKNGSLDFELWYKTDFMGHSLWAVNDKHLEWLNGNMNKRDLSCFERTYAETLPKGLLQIKTKLQIS